MTAGYLEFGLAGLVPLLLAAAGWMWCAGVRRVPVRVVIDRSRAGAARLPRR